MRLTDNSDCFFLALCACVRIVLALHVVSVSSCLSSVIFVFSGFFFFLILPGALHNPDLFQAPAPGGAEVMSAFSLRLIQSHHRPTVRVSHAASMEGRI